MLEDLRSLNDSNLEDFSTLKASYMAVGFRALKAYTSEDFRVLKGSNLEAFMP